MSNFDFKGEYKDIKKQKKILNQYGTYITNAVTQADGVTEMGVPIPSKDDVDEARNFQEENEK